MYSEFPRYLQRRFELDIVEGELASGATCTVRELEDRYKAPDTQMRRAVQAALRKGLVEIVEGKSGTFRILGLPTTRFSSVYTHTAQSGQKPRSLVRQAEVEDATPEVAGKLAIEVGSPVYRYVRTRYVNEQVLANQTNYMPYDVCPGLEDDDVSRYSFQRLLEEKYHAVLSDMEEQASLVPATGEDCEILELDAGSSILLIDRIARGATGWPLVWASIRIRPDRYEYVAALWPQAAHLLQNEQHT